MMMIISGRNDVYMWTCKRVKYWGSRTATCLDSISLHPFSSFSIWREKKKNLITKWSSLFSLKTERQWWNSNSIFAFSSTITTYSGKRENYNLSPYSFPIADWERRRCVSFSRVYFMFIERLVAIWWWWWWYVNKQKWVRLNKWRHLYYWCRHFLLCQVYNI